MNVDELVNYIGDFGDDEGVMSYDHLGKSLIPSIGFNDFAQLMAKAKNEGAISLVNDGTHVQVS